jgi:hypothetical protein
MSQDYHQRCVGRAFLSAEHCAGVALLLKCVILKARAFQRAEGSRAECFKLPPFSYCEPHSPRISDATTRIYFPWNFDNSVTPD